MSLLSFDGVCMCHGSSNFHLASEFLSKQDSCQPVWCIGNILQLMIIFVQKRFSED